MEHFTRLPDAKCLYLWQSVSYWLEFICCCVWHCIVLKFLVAWGCMKRHVVLQCNMCSAMHFLIHFAMLRMAAFCIIIHHSIITLMERDSKTKLCPLMNIKYLYLWLSVSYCLEWYVTYYNYGLNPPHPHHHQLVNL